MENGNGKIVFNEEFSKKLKDIIKVEFNNLAEELNQAIEKLKSIDNELVNKEVELLGVYLNWFHNDELLDSQNCVFRQIMVLGALESEINIFGESLNMMQTVSNVKSSLWSIVRSILNKIKVLSSRLWQLLSQIVNLKEWSIAGDANINVLGLSGGVTLKLKFQP